MQQNNDHIAGLDVRQNFFRLMFNARNRIRFAMDDKLKPLGITDATWRTLYFLRQSGDGVQQKVLAKNMAIEGPSLVRLLDNLEAKSLIERKPDALDRRSKTVHLTVQSQPLLAKLDHQANEVRSVLLKDVSDQELATCVAVLNKMLASEEIKPTRAKTPNTPV